MAPIVILIGPTGAGKSWQGKRVAVARGWVYISSGDLVFGSSDPSVVAAAAEGELVPSAVVNRLVFEALKSAGAKPVMLDGYPRMISEADWFEQRLPELGRRIDKVIFFDIDRTESQRRLEARHRQDDNPMAIERKWDEYQRDTLPVLERYRQQGLLMRVDGSGSREAVKQRFEAAI